MKYLFGPVNSRRLGLSLGIDLVPFKTCSLNCIYCECGKTTNLTTKIAEYVPTKDVILELNEFLSAKPVLNAITFAGSGEPTLHSNIRKIISFLKKKFPEYCVTVLTNGALFNIKKVRESILEADIIIPSMDAASEEIFKKIARPAPGISAKSLIKGLIDFRTAYKKTFILEILIIPGINDTEEELQLIKSACKKINPDKIQLNTLDRPGAEKWIKPSSKKELQIIEAFLKPLDVEIIGAPKTKLKKSNNNVLNTLDAIISTISRRPSTVEDLSTILGIEKEIIEKVIDDLLKDGTIYKTKFSRGNFYKITEF